MYHVTMTFRQGPTILDADATPVMIKRFAFTEQQAQDLQAAALTLDATTVNVEREQKQS